MREQTADPKPWSYRGLKSQVLVLRHELIMAQRERKAAEAEARRLRGNLKAAQEIIRRQEALIDDLKWARGDK